MLVLQKSLVINNWSMDPTFLFSDTELRVAQ